MAEPLRVVMRYLEEMSTGARLPVPNGHLVSASELEDFIKRMLGPYFLSPRGEFYARWVGVLLADQGWLAPGLTRRVMIVGSSSIYEAAVEFSGGTRMPPMSCFVSGKFQGSRRIRLAGDWRRYARTPVRSIYQLDPFQEEGLRRRVMPDAKDCRIVYVFNNGRTLTRAKSYWALDAGGPPTRKVGMERVTDEYGFASPMDVLALTDLRGQAPRPAQPRRGI